MALSKDDLNKLLDDLKQQRDELRVKLKLARADARDEFEELEKKWEHVRGKMEVVGREAGKAAEDVASALGLVATEIKKGYERIRKLL
ncbi:MAG: hypothetical protein U0807_13440 [Candidatus Binatia bacterium]